MKMLSREDILTSIHYNSENDKFFLDLGTRAKSELHLYEDGIMLGRYDYKVQIDLDQDEDNLLDALCEEFSEARYGRDYGNPDWFALCEKRLLFFNK